MRKIIPHCFTTFLLVIVFIGSQLSSTAQQGGTTTYVYDDNGRLHAVISPAGEAAVYEYDAAGNIISIRRLAANELAILNFSPRSGLPGDQVTFTGVGFGGGVNNVSFNGASATIVSVAPSRVVATVPETATTGLVTITTPTGSVTTTIPFTIAGVRVTPSSAVIKFGETVQFTAEVLPSTLDQDVVWTVNDVTGGNATVGTISATGLFTAPNIKYSSLAIRATSVAENARFAEASVKVNDPGDLQSVFASSVSVQRGANVGTSALAPEVSVQFGFFGESQSALSKAISVQYGSFSASQSALAGSVSVQRNDPTMSTGAFSSVVSVQRGLSSAGISALANQLSIKYETSVGQFLALNAVSATAGPYIQSISPGNLSRGTATTVTINGVGLTGALGLRFITAAGAIDSNVTASNIVVSGDGNSLTATITVSAGAAIGSRLVIITTPNGDSIGVDLGINGITVQ